MTVDNGIGAVATVTAAIVAAASSAFLAIYLAYERRKSERTALQKDLTRKYMLQLQQVTESLWFRLNNIVERNGRLVMTDNVTDYNIATSYYMTTTIYQLGSFLAYNRIMVLDGTYSQLEETNPGSGDWLKKEFQEFDYTLKIKEENGSSDKNLLAEPDIEKKIVQGQRTHVRETIKKIIDSKMEFIFYYHRIALAEALIDRGVNNDLFILTYLEFKKKYPEIMPFLKETIDFVTVASDYKWECLMSILASISSYLEKKTKIQSSISSYLEKKTKIQSPKEITSKNHSINKLQYLMRYRR